MLFSGTILGLASAAPVIAIRGVFFPLWIFFALGAIIVVVVIREAILAVHGGPVEGLGAIFYTALGVILGLGSYLIRTGGF